MATPVSIAGVSFAYPVMNASGCWCTSRSELDELMVSRAGGVVSKSSTLEPRVGNPEPRLYFDDDFSINSMGLPNQGYKFYANYATLRVKPYIQSIHPFSVQEMMIMLRYIDMARAQTSLVEINLTCPNLSSKTATLAEHFHPYVTQLHRAEFDFIKCGFKMPPLFAADDFDSMTGMLTEFQIPFVTCINSLPNGFAFDIDRGCPRIKPKDGLGGIGGKPIKPFGLASVYQFNRRSPIDIIGCGGIETVRDVLEYSACGAKAVQIGTALLRHGPEIFNTLCRDLLNV
jgi:dihydroorotate dehydrogenase (fumarate)